MFGKKKLGIPWTTPTRLFVDERSERVENLSGVVRYWVGLGVSGQSTSRALKARGVPVPSGLITCLEQTDLEWLAGELLVTPNT